MSIRIHRPGSRLRLALLSLAIVGSAPVAAHSERPVASLPGAVSVQALASRLTVGDLVFIRVPARPFREVAAATGSWTNHVGIVVDVAGAEPVIAESTFPLSRTGTLSRFVKRSEGGRVAVLQLQDPLSETQARQLQEAAWQRLGVFYDTGFDLSSGRQFCSRYVREVLDEATGVRVGEVETFSGLLARRPETDLGFWNLWYFGRIPWERETVTPAALLRSPALRPVFDGVALNDSVR